MNIRIHQTPQQTGIKAAALTAAKIKKALKTKDTARLVLSTGASQLDTIKALLGEDIPWERVEMFHLDEYVDLPMTHKASFRKYLKERFVSKINLKKAYYVDDSVDCMPGLEAAISEAPIDVGLIGIGENTHIAFNDPPADFDTGDAFKVVELDEACKRQQVREGWFETLEDVPRQAISMTVKQIMRCNTIISCVPFAVKADAIRRVLTAEKPDPRVPASILKTHPDFHLYLDLDSWGNFDEAQLRMPEGRSADIQHHRE